ncbi:hypothetical protein GUJ93_ZPchr0002g26065 [Zizania palustris]|uniref:Uncharacterized protein n=1 Tax=Zizania palustris TaxID=103762 RepID=A0A8J5S610_ZIZPA|nr:hypothetical protein GUJ93_ZPchr0002g26065 [Zizania palustris]KAG8061018.1 hypothetical protein GUJ93_ZPchr0002g26065 [Zizania palustris]KAG8061019.1 hypothetical protein GUJ93_ZPchr0002g26065 [Zizania palustris]
MEISEQDLKAQFDHALNVQYASQNKAPAAASETTRDSMIEAESLINLKSKDLKEKNTELKFLESNVQMLEMEWSLVEGESLKNPTPGDRTKQGRSQAFSAADFASPSQHRVVADYALSSLTECRHHVKGSEPEGRRTSAT